MKKRGSIIIWVIIFLLVISALLIIIYEKLGISFHIEKNKMRAYQDANNLYSVYVKERFNHKDDVLKHFLYSSLNSDINTEYNGENYVSNYKIVKNKPTVWFTVKNKGNEKRGLGEIRILDKIFDGDKKVYSRTDDAKTYENILRVINKALNNNDYNFRDKIDVIEVNVNEFHEDEININLQDEIIINDESRIKRENNLLILKIINDRNKLVNVSGLFRGVLISSSDINYISGSINGLLFIDGDINLNRSRLNAKVFASGSVNYDKNSSNSIKLDYTNIYYAAFLKDFVLYETNSFKRID